jgi:FkbM family methyltransferase
MIGLGDEELLYLDLVKDYVSNYPCIYDVGFNHGEYTEEWLKRFPHGCGIGFEPIAELFYLAEDKYKDTKNVAIFNYALSDKIQNDVPFYYLQGEFDGMSSLHYRQKYFPKFKLQEISVELTTLDDIYTYLPKPDMIKIDTEGHEYFVLKGGEKFIDDYQPKFIQFEIGETLWDAGVTFKQIINFLYDKNYKVYDRGFDAITPENVWENTDSQNYLAILNGTLAP